MTSQIRFELPDPAYEDFTWILQDEHGPSSLPPLLAGQRFGAADADAEGETPRGLRLNGFYYVRAGAGRPGGAANPFGSLSPPASVDDLTSWRREWLPEVDTVVKELEAFDPATVEPGEWQATIDAQRAAYQRVFAGVHRSAAMPSGGAARRFTDEFVARFGEERRADVLVLLQGFPNRSLERAGALWDLSRILRAEASLLDALDRGEALPDSAAARRFEAGFAAMLAEFGYMSNAELQDMPTWREDPSIPMSTVRAYARQADDRDPRLAAAAQREQRLLLEGELRAQAGDDPSLATLIPLMEMAQQLLPNIEDHNCLADQRMQAASRGRWLAIGRHLVAAGSSLASPDDVFHLHPAELESALEGRGGPPLPEVEERRRFLTACRASSPPPILGKPPAAPDEAAGFGLEARGSRVLRGVSASRGSYRGRARVIETLAQAASLVEGDILVCRSTTPPWSPFFGVIAALVTNSGGALSHGAVVAREFGIPAVAGTVNATALVPDGAMITVDGTNGMVIID